MAMNSASLSPSDCATFSFAFMSQGLGGSRHRVEVDHSALALLEVVVVLLLGLVLAPALLQLGELVLQGCHVEARNFWRSPARCTCRRLRPARPATSGRRFCPSPSSRAAQSGFAAPSCSSIPHLLAAEGQRVVDAVLDQRCVGLGGGKVQLLVQDQRNPSRSRRPSTGVRWCAWPARGRPRTSRRIPWPWDRPDEEEGRCERGAGRLSARKAGATASTSERGQERLPDVAVHNADVITTSSSTSQRVPGPPAQRPSRPTAA